MSRETASSRSSALLDAGAAVAAAGWRRRISALYAEARAAQARETDPSAPWRRWREGRDALLRTHPASPVPPAERAGRRASLFAPYDPTWRLTVDVAPIGSARSRGAGGDDSPDTPRFRPIAVTRGLAGRLGAELTLFWIEGYGGGLFLPFRDRGDGRGGYPGGRRLIDGARGADLGEDADGRLLLDFNYAYNPDSAYDPARTVPLSPPENRLSVEIPVGERYETAGGAAAAGAR